MSRGGESSSFTVKSVTFEIQQFREQLDHHYASSLELMESNQEAIKAREEVIKQQLDEFLFLKVMMEQNLNEMAAFKRACSHCSFPSKISSSIGMIQCSHCYMTVT